MRSGWHRNRHGIAGWSRILRRELATAPAGTVTLLSAHSLPERLRAAGDPYPEILTDAAGLLAEATRPLEGDFTYQSAGNTTEPWLRPDITEKILEWRARGHPEQLIAPIGFVFEHLEVLYDLDHVVRRFAEEHGVRYRRTPMPNEDDLVVESLREVALNGVAPPPGHDR